MRGTSHNFVCESDDLGLRWHRGKKEAERLRPDRKEVKTEIQYRDPAGIESRPAKAGRQPEANIGSSSAMAALSVWSESRSRVIESRNADIVGAFAKSLTGGSIEAPQRPGAEIRPGSESTARGHKGSLGTCEIRLSPSFETNQSKGETGLRTPWRKRSGLGLSASENVRATRRVLLGECNEPGEKGSGSLSGFIVAMESRRTDPREPVSSEGSCRNTEPSLGNTR